MKDQKMQNQAEELICENCHTFQVFADNGSAGSNKNLCAIKVIELLEKNCISFADVDLVDLVEFIVEQNMGE